jgi:hypothetical protein
MVLVQNYATFLAKNLFLKHQIKSMEKVLSKYGLII